jgi:hypothetical protein
VGKAHELELGWAAAGVKRGARIERGRLSAEASCISIPIFLEHGIRWIEQEERRRAANQRNRVKRGFANWWL